MGCPCVNDDQEIDVDDQKCNSSSPHDDYWILENLFYKILFFLFFYCPANQRHLRTTTNACG